MRGPEIMGREVYGAVDFSHSSYVLFSVLYVGIFFFFSFGKIILLLEKFRKLYFIPNLSIWKLDPKRISILSQHTFI